MSTRRKRSDESSDETHANLHSAAQSFIPKPLSGQAFQADPKGSFLRDMLYVIRLILTSLQFRDHDKVDNR